jgi:dihydrofolate reductase
MRFKIIVAMARNRAIGKDNELLWKIKDDLKLFKSSTLNHTVLMGRKSFQSIGRPLPKRHNVVVTRSKYFKAEGVEVFRSLNDALAELKQRGEDVFILGGGQIYKQSMDDADELYISHVDADIQDADTFFPEVDWNAWECVEEMEFPKNEANEFGFVFRRYQRK